MTTRWRKLGLLYAPSEKKRHPKLLTHAANPLPIHIERDVYRIFFSGRDERNRSSVGAVDVDIVKQEILVEHIQPFFEHGPENSFYSDGVSIGSCYASNGIRYILFMGWQSPPGCHWRGDIGRLIVRPDLTLVLRDAEPLMSSDPEDPISLSYPWVHANASGGFDMWYGSTISWDAGNGEMLHVIKHAQSEDGDTWSRSGRTVPFKEGIAQAFSRPSVIQNLGGDFEMWFSYRSGAGKTYRIGHATSPDSIRWALDLDNVGIDVSNHGWDSEMIEYPFVFDHNGDRFMLYNGNGYGRSGFGLAVLTG